MTLFNQTTKNELESCLKTQLATELEFSRQLLIENRRQKATGSFEETAETLKECARNLEETAGKFPARAETF